MANNISQDDILKIKAGLYDSKSTNRRSSAKKIGNKRIIELGDDLFKAYLEEKEDIRTWETQTAMINSLGKIGYKNAIPELKKILEINKEHDTITSEAASAFIRITRKNKNDASPVINLIENGKLSILNGATSVLTYDDMIPTDEEIVKIINFFNSKDEKDLVFIGAGDPRSYLISAMSKWKKELTINYLNKFINDSRLKTYTILALEGKKSRYE